MKKVSLSVIVLLCTLSVWAQNRIPLIGEKASSFKVNSTNGEINFPDDFGTNWKILFSHPRDFTPVCTSEVLQLARMQDEFNALGVKIAVISSDQVSQHEKWKESIEDIEQEGKTPVKISFPILDDSKMEVYRLYGMLHEKSNDAKYSRGVFIIDPANTIQAIFFYPMNVGRNMEEIKRTVVALQTVSAHVSTPANWEPGNDVLIPASPYLNPSLKDNAEIQKQYYNIGSIMWYKKM